MKKYLYPLAILLLSLLALSACGRGGEDPEDYAPHDYDTGDYTPYEHNYEDTTPGGYQPYTYYPSAYQPEPDPSEIDGYYEVADVYIPRYDEGEIVDPPQYIYDNIIINGHPLVGVNHRIVGDDNIFPTHVPLVPVAEALGSGVNWDRADNSITMDGINGPIAFPVGSDSFVSGGTIVTLGQPSVEIDGVVYVPILFFRDVFGMRNAMFYGGHVVIDDSEPMV